MSEIPGFTTVSMAEILLVQDLLKDAAEVIEQLERQHPGDERVAGLRRRIEQRTGSADTVQEKSEPAGNDTVELATVPLGLRIAWELSPTGLDIAKRAVRYSGDAILRVFTATPGPRGVRTGVHDFILQHPCGQMTRTGYPPCSVHTAAVGFLGRNGAFVPMARALPVSTP